jgi:predicted Zn-dependent protease
MKTVLPFLLLCCFGPAALRAQYPSSSELWNNPEFTKAFLGSYGVDPGLEPALSDEDRKVLNTLQTIISESRDTAIVELEGYVNDSTNARFDLILGNLYLEANNLPKAEENYRQAIVKFPNFRSVYRNLSLVAAQQQRFPEAAKYLVKTLELGDADPAVYGMLARCHLGAGDAVAAESAFRQAVLLEPGKKDWRQGLIASLIRQKKLVEATAALDEMIVRDPANVSLLQQQAQVYAAANNLPKAAECLEMVARRGAAKPEDLYQLGDIYLSSKQPIPAFNAYQRAFAADTALGEKAIKAIEVLVAYNNPAEAGQLAAQLESKLGSGPLKARLLRVKARLALQAGANAEAAALLRQVVDEDPLDGQGWMLLGKHYQDSGDSDQAVFAYERASSVETTKADAKIRLAQIAVAKNEYSKAVNLLEEALKITPRDSVARYLDQIRALARSKGGA